MKHVVLKKIPLITPKGEQGELDYRVYLEVAIKNPLDGKSMAIEEMRRSIRLLDALEKAKDRADFEDADFEFLKQKVQALHFSWTDRAFVQFVDDVTQSK